MRTIPQPSEQSKIKNITARRIIVLSACLLLLAGAVVLPSRILTVVNAQRAARTAKRINLPGKSRKSSSLALSPNARVISQSQTNEDGTITPGQLIAYPVDQTTEQVMRAQENRGAEQATKRMPELEQPARKNLPDGPGSTPAAQWPLPDKSAESASAGGTVTPSAPQTLGTQFDGATGPTETGAFPPDT